MCALAVWIPGSLCRCTAYVSTVATPLYGIHMRVSTADDWTGARQTMGDFATPQCYTPSTKQVFLQIVKLHMNVHFLWRAKLCL